jgi:hypothetical protein
VGEEEALTRCRQGHTAVPRSKTREGIRMLTKAMINVKASAATTNPSLEGTYL